MTIKLPYDAGGGRLVCDLMPVRGGGGMGHVPIQNKWDEGGKISWNDVNL